MTPSPRVDVTVDDQVISVSNPDREYYPGLGAAGRKMALIEHVIAVGEGLLRALENRPTYLQRFPDGIDGEEVYQKRLPPKAPAWLRRCRVTFPSGRSADALSPVSVADLVWAVQMSTLTFHPWPARCDDVERPDMLRIDLDPQPGTDFDHARSVALDVVRPVLDELGYVGFPKTSGGRGIHIDVPIQPRWDFSQCRRAALALGREVERRDPLRSTVAWWKEQRGSRVFVDYNQMARDRTIAAAYSPRRTARGTVSMPVTWEELSDVNPDDFTVVTAATRFATVGDLQRDMRSTQFSLEPLLEWVERDEREGEGEAPYPPNYPKMPGEPMRVQPSRAKGANGGSADVSAP